MKAWAQFALLFIHSWEEDGEKLDSCIPRALAQSEMQTALFRIWTLIIDSIFYDDNHNAKCTSGEVLCN